MNIPAAPLSAVGAYLGSVEKALGAGNATEHTYRPFLQTLIEALVPGATATNEPKRIACGAPDFIVTRAQTPLGYVEAKDVPVSLDKTEKSEQLDRYRASLGNLILTNGLEFRWYVGGAHRLTARLARAGAGKNLVAETNGAADVAALFSAFAQTNAPTVKTPRELAARMAALAILAREAIAKALAAEDKGGTLHQQQQGFRQTLLRDLSDEQFADMYAQTIGYGLFAARVNARSGARFSREHAAFDLPKTNPFLRKMFGHIAGPDLDERVVWVVDDLADLLDRADMNAILADFGKRTRQEDPVVHFYETFLAAYDPKMRESRGVYYTPEPVVSYIVRSVDHLLKTEFGLPDGLADASKVRVKTAAGGEEKEVHRVQILDPATGTGTFLHGVVDRIAETFAGNKGMWSGYVRDHLLPRVFGFELLMAPYAVAHMKLGLQLKESGYDFASDERLGVYLTNTLEEANAISGGNLFAQWVVEEANAASGVKQNAPVMVVLGNPPYSGHSANKGAWIGGLLRGPGGYFEVDGKPLGEKNPKWLNDDYVKFIRFAQWRIEQTGYGVLAFISNHGYLDNPTFRGMRQSLMETFDDIYVLDLHGNSKKKERAPDGSKDENVFDIQQGVAIGIFVKRLGQAQLGAVVRHAHLWGERRDKYAQLSENDTASTSWSTLSPQPPFYLFVPQDIDLRAEYEQGWKVAEALPVATPGVVTGQDERTIAFSRQEAESLASQVGLEATVVTDLAYRPLDRRFIVYHSQVVTRPRTTVMRHMLRTRNLGLVTTRVTKDQWDCLVTNSLIGHKALAAYDINTLFPLYLYPTAEGSKKSLFDGADPTPNNAPGGRRPNLAPAFIADIEARLGLTFVPDGKGDKTQTFGPEDVFDYLYAVFHSPAYRARYAEFLKIDFPRLPLTRQSDLFRDLCALGTELVALHLLEKTGPNPPAFPESGDNVIENVRYEETGGGRVYLNKTQHFAGVPADVWNFHVGGYQVCQKWLKDRKGRALSFDDLRHYQRVVAALGETIHLMAGVDEAIAAHGGWPLT